MIHRGTKVLVHLAAGKDAFQTYDDINDVLNMAEEIITNQDVYSETPPRGFAFETGFVPVVWLLAINCPGAAMRGRLISRLMKMWARSEGL